jgi:hypothetical protein
MHQHSNYGYGKTRGGDYFCLQCGEQRPSSEMFGGEKVEMHQCVDPTWPLDKDTCEPRRFF